MFLLESNTKVITVEECKWVCQKTASDENKILTIINSNKVTYFLPTKFLIKDLKTQQKTHTTLKKSVDVPMMIIQKVFTT